jgi:hypothetical protein
VARGAPTEDVEARKRAHLINEGPTQELRWKIKVLRGFFYEVWVRGVEFPLRARQKKVKN